MTSPVKPLPVTGTVIAKDIAERAFVTFIQAAIPTLTLLLSATSWHQAKALGLSAAVAGGAAVLSLVKSLAASYVTGTASFSKQVAQASSHATPPPSSEVYDGPQIPSALDAHLGDDLDDATLDDDTDTLDDDSDTVDQPVEPDGELDASNLDPEHVEKLAGNRPRPAHAAQ